MMDHWQSGAEEAGAGASQESSNEQNGIDTPTGGMHLMEKHAWEDVEQEVQREDMDKGCLQK
jgi:hypothetical protein